MPSIQYPSYTQSANGNAIGQSLVQQNIPSIMYVAPNDSPVSSGPAWYPNSRTSYHVTSNLTNIATTVKANIQYK